MSIKIGVIKRSGIKGTDLDITQFCGNEKNKQMLWITQGMGLSPEEPGFIQLTLLDTYQLVRILSGWINTVNKNSAEVLAKKISLEEGVSRASFIKDLDLVAATLKSLNQIKIVVKRQI